MYLHLLDLNFLTKNENNKGENTYMLPSKLYHNSISWLSVRVGTLPVIWKVSA